MATRMLNWAISIFMKKPNDPDEKKWSEGENKHDPDEIMEWNHHFLQNPYLKWDKNSNFEVKKVWKLMW